MQPEPGEQVFFHGHAAWRSRLAQCAEGIGLSLLAGVAAGIAGAIVHGRVRVWWVVAAVIVCFLASVAAIQLRRVRTTYSITSRRLTIETGLLSRELHQTRLERIQNVNARQSVAQRALRIGTVDFDTAGEAQFEFAFRGVSDPGGLVRTVDRALHELHELHERRGPQPALEPPAADA
ncbi:MAG: PH domain-containing protein [Solirubrobacteraceae bacterium]